MFPAPFTYHRATTVSDALDLLQQHADTGKLIAGGHSLLPVMKMRLADPGTLIDIGRIESLKGITYNSDSIRIGALTVRATVEHDAQFARGDGCRRPGRGIPQRRLERRPVGVPLRRRAPPALRRSRNAPRESPAQFVPPDRSSRPRSG